MTPPTSAPAAPRAIKHLSIVIDDVEYNRHVNDFKVTPTTPTVNWKGGTPDALYADSGPSTHVATANLVHDYQNPESFYNFLLEHQGEQASIAYKPDIDGVFTATTTVTLVPPIIGGVVDNFNSSTVSMGATKPVIAPFAPAAPGLDALVPAGGGTAGENLVQIEGSGFATATSVKFAADSVPFSIVNDHLIIAAAPAHAAGSVSVTVVNPTGTSAGSPYLYA